MTAMQLRSKRGELADQARSILTAADGRDLTAEEQRKFDALHADIERLGRQVQAMERQAEVDLELGTSQGVLAGREDTHPIRRTTHARALGRDESVVKYMRERGAIGTDADVYRDLTPGDAIAAYLRGPRNDAERRVLEIATGSAGGFTVPDALGSQLVDALRQESVIFRAGASIVPMDSNKHILPAVDSDPVAGWREENAPIDESDPSFRAITFTARSLAVYCKVSRELLEDSAVGMGEEITRLLAIAMATQVDRVALVGSGIAPEPKGLRTQSGVLEHSMGTDGATPTSYAPFITATKLLMEANAKPATAAVMSPRTWATFAGLTETGSGQPLERPSAIENLPFVTTNVMPNDEVQGEASNASAIMLGYYPDLLVGIRTTVEITPLRERFATDGQVGFLAWLRGDIQLRHAASFCKIVGVKP
jgi:HK97 family phage major capsid protein